MAVNVGIMFEAQEGMGWDEWKRAVENVEDLGFESLWRSDHLTSLVGRPHRSTVDAWASLTYLAGATSRIRFGTLVSPVSWRHPSILGLTAASVSALSGGRLEVGIGAGWNETEHRSFGICMPPTAARLAMLEEAAQVLRLLWTEPAASFQGAHFSLENAYGNPSLTKESAPPLVIGALSPKTIAIAARRADEWNTYGALPEDYRAKRDLLDRECEANGRSPASIRRSVAAPVVIAKSDAALRRRIDALVGFFPLPLQFPPGRAPFTASVLRDLGWFVGTPSDVLEQAEAIATEGVHRVILHCLDANDRESLELIASEVLHALPATRGPVM